MPTFSHLIFQSLLPYSLATFTYIYFRRGSWGKFFVFTRDCLLACLLDDRLVNKISQNLMEGFRPSLAGWLGFMSPRSDYILVVPDKRSRSQMHEFGI